MNEVAEEENDLGSGLMHMDLASDHGDATPRQAAWRFFAFFGWLVALLASTAAIGLIPTVPIFIIAYMWVENRERWILSVPVAIIMTLFVYFVFDRALNIPWPGTLIGEYIPGVRELRIPSVR